MSGSVDSARAVTPSSPLGRRGVLHALRGRAAEPGHGHDAGAALVLVIGSMLVLAMLAMTALAYTMQSQTFARYSQDHTGAMAAAQSGIEDIISRLNRDDAYADTLDCTGNPALVAPTTSGTNSCGWTTTTPVGWQPVVPGETDPDAAHFHYAIDGSRALLEGTVLVTATGRVNGEYRTIEAAVGKGGSTDYVYYTDFESADPSNVQAYPSTPAAACGGAGYDGAQYWYEGRNTKGCVEITFISGDHLNGGVFTNDSAWSNGAHFEDGFISANPDCLTVTGSTSTWKNCLRNSGGSTSTANFYGIRPAHDDPLYLDDTSAAFATFPGCHYYGSTRIIFNANGTMTVWNKTVNNGGTAPRAESGPVGTPTCGSLADLDSPAGATVPVPDQMVVYVAPAPAAANRVQCNADEIGGPAGRELPLGTYDRTTHSLTGTHPDYTYDTSMTETTKTCQEGNLYVEGTVNGRVTVAAAQSVITTGDLVLAGGRNGDDILGLVATNSVEVFHPRLTTYEWERRYSDCRTWGWGSRTYQYCPTSASEVGSWPTRYTDPTTGGLVPLNGIQIAGSIQTLQHSFYVQQYDVGGSAGTLNVWGSIAQRWRGIVGKGSNGYTKLYEYDRRLIYGPPPYFPRWTNAQWSLRYSGEIQNPASVKVT